jgi:hypothetical protein
VCVCARASLREVKRGTEACCIVLWCGALCCVVCVC